VILLFTLSPLPAIHGLIRFVEEFKKVGGVWIMKPIGAAQGKGIFLFAKLSEISEWRTDYRYRGKQTPGGDKSDPSQNGEAGGGGGGGGGGKDDVEAYVVQRYISNPYLIGGKKFDMRIYCLVTRWVGGYRNGGESKRRASD